ncbi:PREDICTED: probable xyloglucan galactosyltransferase GT14 [Prunus mume]|uniref:Probable xyloglucan galactosyltransferase GT14 n=1 Tax=Prunus mume TaxID=102107 RepID=A0ABM0NCR9_PRUMU|nr:PREDICTED: probable xyloglucan galactosyltransferase GT14 [Prunus mume]
MNEKGIIPDVVTFTSLISAACKSGKWEEAVRLFRNLIDSIRGQAYESVPSFKQLQPPGDSHTRRSTFDSFLAGCIPVFFHPATAYTQYLWHLPENHTKNSVFIPVKEVEDLKEGIIEKTLLGISMHEELAMRDEVIRLIPNLVYADPRSRLETEDAFDLAV